jgi:hypothetical protein
MLMIVPYSDELALVTLLHHASASLSSSNFVLIDAPREELASSAPLSSMMALTCLIALATYA